MLVKTSTTERRFSRRALLGSMGASAALLPLLSTEPALGATADAPPKRLVTITWTNGICQNIFYPPTDTNPVAGQVLTPLAALQSKVILVAGLDYKHMIDIGHTYDGHYSYPLIFTGAYKNTGGQTCTSDGPSIDQVISDALAKKVSLPMPLMNIAVNGDSTSYHAAGQRNTGENNPGRLFNTVFGSSAMPSDQMSALRARRKSVLDYLQTELSGFEARMGADDRAKIEAHMDSVRQLETELTATANACTPPTTNTTSKNYQDIIKAMCDIAAMALRCDLTRVVSMVWGADGGSNPGSFPFIGVSSDYHAIAHLGTSGYPDKLKIDQWYYTQVANLATQLDASVEGAGTTLDNSVIVTGNDMAEGSSHSVGGMAFVLIGGCGGYFNTGRVVRVGSWATKSGNYWSAGNSGVSHNKLLATLSNAMDVPVTSFGTTYTGALDQLAK